MQSAVVRHVPPRAFSKHLPPVHFPDRHCVPEVQVVPGHEARQRFVVALQLPLWHWVDALQTAVVLPYGILQIPPMQVRPEAQFVVVVQRLPAGQDTVQAGGGLTAAAGASADCSSGVVQTTAPTTAPRWSRARRVRPCASGAGAIAAGRPGSGGDSVPETAVR